MELRPVFYHLEIVDVHEHAPIETFDSVTPFPQFVTGHHLDLREHAAGNRWVWHTFTRIAHTPDQRELHITSIVVVGYQPPRQEDLDAFNVRTAMDRLMKDSTAED